MSVYYIDTSALVKRYVEEPHSDIVQQIIEESDTLLTSGLTELEMVSSLERLKKSRLIDSPTYRSSSKAFEADVSRNSITFLAVTREILASAKELIRLHYLRAPDAIQLASALFVRRKMHMDPSMLCYDRPLLDAARLEGLKCVSID